MTHLWEILQSEKVRVGELPDSLGEDLKKRYPKLNQLFATYKSAGNLIYVHGRDVPFTQGEIIAFSSKPNDKGEFVYLVNGGGIGYISSEELVEALANALP